MSRRKITDVIRLMWQKHDNAGATVIELEKWTTERRDYHLSRLDWIEKSIDQGNHEAYRIALNQLKASIQQQKVTLDKVHDLLIYEETPKK